MAAEEGTGSVGISLDLGSGTTLISVHWTIGNGTNSYSGDAAIGDAQSIEFVQGGIAAGAGYTVQLVAADTGGDVCTGISAPFAVTAGEVAQTDVALVCLVADGSTPGNVNTGTVEVDASVLLEVASPIPCPGISSFSINPAAIGESQSAALTLVTVGPSPLITWSVSPATGGAFADAHAAATTFVCATAAAFAPQVTITALVTLSGSGLCDGQRFTTTSAPVNCLGG